MRLALPLILILSSALPAQGLDDALSAADELASAGNPAAARQSLAESIADIPDHGEVLARIAEIQQRLGDWAYAAQMAEPEPQDLFQGQLKSFKEKGLKIRLVYDWEQLSTAARQADFFQAGDRWFFRVPFAGDLKYVLKGRWPADPKTFAMLLGFDEEGESGWRFTPGFKRTKVKPSLVVPRRLERIGKPFEVFLTDTEKIDEPEGAWAYTAELRRGSFTFKRGSRKIGSWKTAYPELAGGFLGFSGVGIQEIDFTGKLDPGAWANRRATLLEERRERFLREEYRVDEDMPAWFAEMKAASTAQSPMRPPEGVPEEAAAAWAELLDPGQVLQVTDWAGEHGGLDAAATAYASAIRHLALGEWEACAAQAKLARQAGMGDFGPLHALEWRARFHLGQRQKATEELRRLLPAWPDDAGYPLARLIGRIHGPRKMLETLEEVVAAGGLSDRVTGTRRVLQAVFDYASTEGLYRHSGSLFQLLSDGDPSFAEDIGKSAVGAVAFINRYWSQIKPPLEPLLILHFRNQDGRRAFCQRAGIDEESEGYLPAYRFSLVVLDPEHADPLSPAPLFRALWPQMLDTTLDVERLPRWFIHGFAGILGGCRFVDGGLQLEINLDLVRRSAENEDGWFFAPQQLVTLPNSEWDKHAYWAVCESYLLLRYLWAHAPQEQQNRFRAYTDALFQGKTRAEAYQALFGGVDLAALVEALAAHRQGEIDQL